MKTKERLLKKNFTYLIIIGIVSALVMLILYFFLPYKESHLNNTDEVIITYADNISETHQIIIDKFNEEYKGRIKVQTINLPFKKFSTNERKELLTRSLRSKSDRLDVFAVDLIWSARFAKWSEPLDDYIVKNDTMGLVNQALKSCIFNGSLVALPMYVDIGLMYYRKDLIKKLPNYFQIEQKLKKGITWQEFIGLRKYFTLKDNQFYIFPADNYEGLVCSYFEVLSNNYPKSDTNINFKLNDEQNRRTLTLLKDLVYKYNLSPKIITDFKENNCYQYFTKNDGIFLRGWPSSEKDIKNLMNQHNIDSLIGRAALPHIEGSSPSSVIGGWNLMLSKYSEHKKEAFEFMKFILREDSQKLLFAKGSYLPTISKLYEDREFIKNHKGLAYTKKLLDNGIHRPFLDNYTKLSDVISYYTNQVLKGNMSIDSALISADKSLNSGELILR